MVAPARLRLFVLMLVAAAVLVACGGAPAAAPPTAAPEPTAKPTLTPRPTATPKPTAEPTAAPTEEPTAEPEPTAPAGDADSVLKDVVIGDLETYTHANNLFAIDVPGNWTLKDHSKPGEAIVAWTDPAENAFMQVDLFQQDQQQTKDELSEFLKQYLERTFGSFENFSQDPAKESGPSMLIVWSYDAEGTGGVKARLLGNSFIKQVGNKTSLFTMVVPDNQFDQLVDSLNAILGSYTIDDTAEIAMGNTDVAIGDLETFEYDAGLFSIDVPKGWNKTDNSKAGEAIMLWSAPNGLATVVVDLFEQKDEQSPEDLTKFLETFLADTFGQEDGFNVQEPKAQQDGSVLLVYTYNDSTRAGLKVLGNSFIEQRGDKVSILSVIVPSEQFDTLKPYTDKIINSYTIDPDAALP